MKAGRDTDELLREIDAATARAERSAARPALKAAVDRLLESCAPGALGGLDLHHAYHFRTDHGLQTVAPSHGPHACGDGCQLGASFWEENYMSACNEYFVSPYTSEVWLTPNNLDVWDDPPDGVFPGAYQLDHDDEEDGG